jgi:CYTH domain-containing protein
MILEIEVDHPEEEVDLPPFIPIEREITDDPSYSNWALAARV